MLQAGAREVTATITDSGLKTLVDITVTDGSGSTDTLTATDNHPFWAPQAGEWTPAAELTWSTTTVLLLKTWRCRNGLPVIHQNGRTEIALPGKIGCRIGC